MSRRPKKKPAISPQLFFDRKIDFHGYTGDEAIYELEEVLAISDGESILVVHGVGSGILRQRIRNFLASSSLAKAVEYGETANIPGGAGVTVVYT